MSLSPPPVLCERRDGARIELDLGAVRLEPGGDDVFSGHFDEHPVLAGLLQLSWAVELGQRYLSPETRFPPLRDLGGVKFQKVIQPGQLLSLELGFDAAAGELRFRYHHAGETFSSGRLRAGGEAGADG